MDSKDIKEIIDAYKDGESMSAISKRYSVFPCTISRILQKNGVELRHDVRRRGEIAVTGGEKLIEWAKAQGRPVTKAELAHKLGISKLTPAYLSKYPELSHYIASREQKELHDSYTKLYTWLQENNIPYKPKDRTKLGVTIDALLLNEYSGHALHIVEKPRYVSRAVQAKRLNEKKERAEAAGVKVFFLDPYNLDNLDDIKALLKE